MFLLGCNGGFCWNFLSNGGNIEQTRGQNQVDTKLQLFVSLNWKHIGKRKKERNFTEKI